MKRGFYIKLALWAAATLIVVIFIVRCKENVPPGYDRVLVHADQVIVDQSFLDSLQYIAELPPDTIETKVWIKGDPYEVIVPAKELTPLNPDNPSEDSTNRYRKALINVGIDAWVEIKVKGYLENFKWGHSPLYLDRKMEINKPVPFPVIQIQKVTVPQRGLYVMGGIGGNFPRAAGSLELLIQQRNGVMYGPQVIFLGDERYYLAKFAIKLF